MPRPRFARSGSGDVTALQGEFAGSYRLRLGDYRVLFTLDGDVLLVSGVRHPSQVYR